MVNRILGWCAIAAFVMFGAVIIADNDSYIPGEADAPGLANPHPGATVARIEPETLVRFPEGAIACLNKESLRETIQHTLNHEATKTVAMLSVHGGDCTMLSPLQRVKVISAEYDDPTSEIGLLEVVGPEVISRAGAWTLSVGAIPVSVKRAEHR